MLQTVLHSTKSRNILEISETRTMTANMFVGSIEHIPKASEYACSVHVSCQTDECQITSCDKIIFKLI